MTNNRVSAGMNRSNLMLFNAIFNATLNKCNAHVQLQIVYTYIERDRDKVVSI